MYDRLRRPGFGDSAIVVACRVLTIILALLYVKIYTGELEKAELGIFFYITTLAYAVNALIFVPYDMYFQSRISQSGSEIDVRKSVESAVPFIGAALAMSVGLSLILWLAGHALLQDIIGVYLNALSLYVCTAGRNLLNNRGHRRFVSIALVVEAALRITVLLFVLQWVAATGRVLNYSGIVALSLEALIIAAYMRRNLKFASTENPFGPLRTVVRAAYPLSISAVCSLLQLQSYRLLFTWAGYSSTAASYAVVSNVGAAGMSAASSVYAQMFMPALYSAQGRNFRQYAAKAAALSLFVLAVALVLQKPIVALATHEAYLLVSPLIGFGIFVEAGNLINGAASLVLMFRSATSKILAVNFVACALSISGQVAALLIAPENPYLIGVPIIVSQAVVVAALIYHTSARIHVGD